MNELSLCDRIEAYAATGMGVVIPSEDALKLVKAARYVGVLVRELERERAGPSGWEGLLKRNQMILGTLWGLGVGFFLWGWS